MGSHLNALEPSLAEQKPYLRITWYETEKTRLLVARLVDF